MKSTLTDSLLAGIGTIGVGHSISGGDMADNPQTDIALKIILPIISGILFPFLKNVLEDLREDIKNGRRKRMEKRLARKECKE